MTQVQVLDASPGRSGGYKVDVGRGQRVGRVSSEWFSRPADERYLSLDALMASVKGRAERIAGSKARSAHVGSISKSQLYWLPSITRASTRGDGPRSDP
jgi:hypothetical protein